MLMKKCRRAIRNIRDKNNFRKDLLKFKESSIDGKMPIKEIVPILTDKYKAAGTIDEHYFLQDIYVAKKVIEANPEKHYDIGSRIDGFISHLLLFLNRVIMIDIRPLPQKIEGLDFVQGDATNLTSIRDNSIESLSSLHAVEHFGLGRYGDEINPEACFLAMKSMQRVIRGGGHFVSECACGA